MRCRVRLLIHLIIISLFFLSFYIDGLLVQSSEITQPRDIFLAFLSRIIVAIIGVSLAVYLSKTVSKSLGQRLSLVVIWLIVSIQISLAVGRLLTYSDDIQIAQEILTWDDEDVINVGPDHLMINGLIGLNTLNSFKNKELSNIQLLELRSSGGLIDAAMEIGKLVERHQISTFVGEECASACVLIAIKGKFLFATPTSQFGFHQASSISDHESSYNRFISKRATSTLVRELRAGGIPNSILRSTRDTPSNQMTFYLGFELYREGVVDRLVESR